MEWLLLATFWTHHVLPGEVMKLQCQDVQEIVRRLIKVEDMSQLNKIEVYRELKLVTPHNCALDILA